MDVSGAVVTPGHFQKIDQISSLCNFHYISEGIPSVMRFCLLLTSVMQIWFMRNFARPKKRMSQGPCDVYPLEPT